MNKFNYIDLFWFNYQKWSEIQITIIILLSNLHLICTNPAPCCFPWFDENIYRQEWKTVDLIELSKCKRDDDVYRHIAIYISTFICLYIIKQCKNKQTVYKEPVGRILYIITIIISFATGTSCWIKQLPEKLKWVVVCSCFIFWV